MAVSGSLSHGPEQRGFLRGRALGARQGPSSQPDRAFDLPSSPGTIVHGFDSKTGVSLAREHFAAAVGSVTAGFSVMCLGEEGGRAAGGQSRTFVGEALRLARPGPGRPQP